MSHFIYLEDDAVAWVGRISGIYECGEGDGRTAFDVSPEPDADLVVKRVGEPFQVVRSSMYGSAVDDGALLDRKPDVLQPAH